MNTVIIHGQSHEGSTCSIARLLADKLGGELTEFFLPRDFGALCLGCTNCFMKGEELCPHSKQLEPITKAIDEADVLILASPVYVYHATGAMKALLDHYGYRWMPHRPEEKMFSKQAVCISTAAGAGMKSANKDMADSVFYWGCAKVYTLGIAVAATSWDEVSDKKRTKIESKTTALANRIKARVGKARPSFKTKFMFGIMRMMMKNGWNELDTEYWKQKGWLDNKRPWK